jgi:hypothetical protein
MMKSVFSRGLRAELLQQFGMQEDPDLRSPEVIYQYGGVAQRTPTQLQQGRQLFNDGPYIDAPTAALGTLSSTSIEDMWPGITWTPIFANDAKAGKIYCVRAGGTLSLTGGTMTVTPQWGPAGTAMGASLAQGTVTITIAGFYLAFDTLVQSVGAAGANSKVTGHGFFAFAGGVSSGTANPNTVTFGGTQASVDTTINGNITIRKTASTTNSFIVQNVYIFSRN